MTDDSDSLDTSRDALARQIDAWRKLGPARRLEIALEISEATMELALDGSRARNPPDIEPRRPTLSPVHGP